MKVSKLLLLAAILGLAGCQTTDQVIVKAQKTTDATLAVIEEAFCEPVLTLAVSRRYTEPPKLTAYTTICGAGLTIPASITIPLPDLAE